jgi:hypothetical protein
VTLPSKNLFAREASSSITVIPGRIECSNRRHTYLSLHQEGTGGGGGAYIVRCTSFGFSPSIAK